MSSRSRSVDPLCRDAGNWIRVSHSRSAYTATVLHPDTGIISLGYAGSTASIVNGTGHESLSAYALSVLDPGSANEGLRLSIPVLPKKLKKGKLIAFPFIFLVGSTGIEPVTLRV